MAFDPPHLLKSVRNNLKNHDFLLDNKLISWEYYIEKVYEIESAKPNMLRLVPKLTKQYIELPAFSKMKVKRAAQVFSNTVQAAMMTYMFRSFATRNVSYGSFCEKYGLILLKGHRKG